MNPKHKKIWLKALRSGEYEQGKGALCRQNTDGSQSFCCLGVLQNELEGFDEVPENRFGRASVNGSFCHIPEDLVPWGDQRILAHKNDIAKHSFERIADYIEENL